MAEIREGASYMTVDGVPHLSPPADERQVREISRTKAPPAASARRYLWETLPSVYKDGDFAWRFIEALETVLDPVVAILDALEAYVDPDLAPLDALRLLMWWLGLDFDESWSAEQSRQLLRFSPQLARMRGTKGGLELALRIAFPELPLRIEDRGGVTWGLGSDTKVKPSVEGFVVYCDAPIQQDVQSALARTIEYSKPAQVAYKLRVRTPTPQVPKGSL